MKYIAVTHAAYFCCLSLLIAAAASAAAYFGVVLPLADFSCAWDHKVVMHGRMYVTERRLCFYANFFGLEAKMSLRCVWGERGREVS